MTTSTPWVVREASLDNDLDCTRLATLRYEWRAVERGEVGQNPVDFTAALRSWWAENARTHRAWIGVADDTAVAMAWLATVARVPGPNGVERRSGYVQSAYVTSAWRNRGLGHEVVTELVARARERGLDYLAVHPSALSFTFYERLGFAPTRGVLELDLRARS